jgi:hypothetical protein
MMNDDCKRGSIYAGRKVVRMVGIRRGNILVAHEK